jgi:hypothetical protein
MTRAGHRPGSLLMSAAIRSLAHCTVFCGCLLVPSLVLAADIEIKVGDCKSGVGLIARDAPLALVLQRLSKSLSFKLHDHAKPDRIVNMNVTAPPNELIARLLSSEERFMVSHRRDPRCPGQTRVAQVWLLPKGEASAGAREGRSKTAPPSPTPVTQTATPEQIRSYEAQARQRKQAYDAYVQAHGKPPPGEEQEEARP